MELLVVSMWTLIGQRHAFSVAGLVSWTLVALRLTPTDHSALPISHLKTVCYITLGLE